MFEVPRARFRARVARIWPERGRLCAKHGVPDLRFLTGFIDFIDLPVANLPARWRDKTVVQLSDLHLGGFWGRSLVPEVAAEIDRLQPEVVLITGDLFDGAAGHHMEFVNDLQRIRAERGVYFVSGDHEFYSGIDQSLAAVGAAGFHVIDDEVLDLDGLQLSGHTHAGQLLPFVWLIKWIFCGFHPGLHRLGDFHIYVDSGTGTWGPPLRSGCVSEIALFGLREAGD